MTVGGTDSSLVQTPGEAAVMREALNKSATHPVEGPGSDVKQQNATQPVEASGAGTATQPVEVPSAGPEVLPTGTGIAALHTELTSSDSEEEFQSEPRSPVDGNVPYASNDRVSQQPDWKSSFPAWKQIHECQQGKKGHGKPTSFSQKPAKGSKQCK